MSYKIRIYPNKCQTNIINRTMGACRWIYNDYLDCSYKYYKEYGKRLTGYEYSKLLTKLKKCDEKYMWLNGISSKAIHESFMDADEAMNRFFKKISGFPRFKSRKRNPVTGYYFTTDKVKFKHKKVTLPILGKVRITETKYVPINNRLVGGTIKKDNDKYYAVFRVEMCKDDLVYDDFYEISLSHGIGIDMGIKTFASIANNYGGSRRYKSFIFDKKIQKLEDQKKFFQRLISNKMEVNYKKLENKFLNTHDVSELTDTIKNMMKGESYSNTCRYIQKKINRINEKITNIKVYKIDKFVASLVRLKPRFITIETLDIKDLLENDSSHKLHKYIQDSKFSYFFDKLQLKCYIHDIELRKANKYFASSKLCSYCGHKKKDLKLSDRLYICDHCGNEIDRDLNAALNLVKLKKYSLV